MTPKKLTAQTLQDLIARLDHINRLIVKPNKLVGRAQDRRTNRLCDRQDEAFMAIAHYKAKNLSEFYQKLIVVMQGDDILPRIPEAKSESEGCVNASDEANEALKRSLLADAKRLFGADRDAHLLKLCNDYHAAQRWVYERNGTGMVNEDHPEHDQWEAQVAKHTTLFRRIGKKKAHTWAGVAAKASILPYQTERSLGDPCDDRIEAFCIQLAAEASQIAGTPDGCTAEHIIRTTMDVQRRNEALQKQAA
jgi:hypothetical protein